jgi:hypothetical protein
MTRAGFASGSARSTAAMVTDRASQPPADIDYPVAAKPGISALPLRYTPTKFVRGWGTQRGSRVVVECIQRSVPKVTAVAVPNA